MARYAENTSVSVEKSKAEIEAMLMRHGASQFISGWQDDGKAMVQFRMHGRYVRFILELPDPESREFKQTPSRRYARTAEEAHKAWEQACRSRWRALCLCIKAKLEAVAAGITTFETEFLPHTVLGNGRTVADEMLPRLTKHYETGLVADALPMLGGPEVQP